MDETTFSTGIDINPIECGFVRIFSMLFNVECINCLSQIKGI